MARPREDEEVADRWISIRLPARLIAQIDTARGTTSRARWVRDLIRTALAARAKAGSTTRPPAATKTTARPPSTATAQSRHHHTPDHPVRHYAERGQRMVVMACECGHELAPRRA